MISGAESSWRLLVSGFPQGSVQDPDLFYLFVNDLDEWIEYILSRLRSQ